MRINFVLAQRALCLGQIVACLAVLLGGMAAAHAQDALGICRVSTAGTTGNDGTLWATPMTLQTALSTDGCSEIWVKAGVYKPVLPFNQASVTHAERATSFQIQPGVAVYGGFAGGETARNQRDPQANLTVLSGDIDANDTSNADGIDTTAASIQGDNSYHVVYLDGNTATPILATTGLDGFTITGGDANGSEGVGTTVGGGLFCDASQAAGTCSPTLRHLVLRGNAAEIGGGMASMAVASLGEAASTSNPALTDVVFRGNHATSSGGGLYVFATGAGSPANPSGDGLFVSATGAGSQASPSLRRVSFVGNSAGQTGNWAGIGGGMANDVSSGATVAPLLQDVRFDNNTSNNGGYGGGVSNSAYHGTCSPVFANVTFDANHADTTGGGVNNLVNHGGTISPTFRNVTFVGNSAGTQGGVMYSDSGQGTVDVALNNVSFHGNSAGSEGGALYNMFTPPGAFSMSLSNVIAWGDSAPVGAEIANVSNVVPAIDHSIVQGSGGSANWSLAFGADGGANLDVDPLLGALANHGGFTDTLVPAANSPAIDAGSCSGPTVDQRGIARAQGAGCDIGAVEVPVVAYMTRVYGSDQSAAIWHDFASPLIVQVVGLNSAPASQVEVQALPATAGQAGARCTDARTDSSGFAYLYCRANGHAGSYGVTVQAVGVLSGVTPTTSFSLTNSDNGDTIFRDGFDPPGATTAALFMPVVAGLRNATP